MLSDEEKRFIRYWEQNRRRKRNWLWMLATGLPLGAFFAAAIFVNYFSGFWWYRRAAMEINLDSSGVLVVLAGLLMIVVFIVVFSSRHKWDQNEQRYRELLAREKDGAG
jgi:polyferredoxin